MGELTGCKPGCDTSGTIAYHVLACPNREVSTLTLSSDEPTFLMASKCEGCEAEITGAISYSQTWCDDCAHCEECGSQSTACCAPEGETPFIRCLRCLHLRVFDGGEEE